MTNTSNTSAAQAIARAMTVFAHEANLTLGEHLAARHFYVPITADTFGNPADFGYFRSNSGIILPRKEFCASRVFVGRTPISMGVDEDGVPYFRRSPKSLNAALQFATAESATCVPFDHSSGACILQVDSLMAMTYVADEEIGFYPEPFLYQKPFASGVVRQTSVSVKFGTYSTGKMTAEALASAASWRQLLAAEIFSVIERMGLGASTQSFMLTLVGFCSDYRQDNYKNPDGSKVSNYGFAVEHGGLVFSIEPISGERGVHQDVAVKTKGANHYRSLIAKGAVTTSAPLPKAAKAPTKVPAPKAPAPKAPMAQNPPKTTTTTPVVENRAEGFNFPSTWTVKQRVFFAHAIFYKAYGNEDSRTIQTYLLRCNLEEGMDFQEAWKAVPKPSMATAAVLKAQLAVAVSKVEDFAAEMAGKIHAANDAKVATPAAPAPAAVTVPAVTTKPPAAVTAPVATSKPPAAGVDSLRAKIASKKKAVTSGFAIDVEEAATPSTPPAPAPAPSTEDDTEDDTPRASTRKGWV